MKKNNHQLDLIRIGEKIRSERVARGLSQEALAWNIGISRHFMSMMENGNKAARIETYYKAACALDVSLSDLFREKIEIEFSDEVIFLLRDCSRQEAQLLLNILRAIKQYPKIRNDAVTVKLGRT